MTRQRDRESGFSLLEVTVSLFLSGLVIFFMQQIAGSWLASWRTALVRIDQSELIAVARKRFAEDLASALPLDDTSATSVKSFMGSASRFRLIKPAFATDAPYQFEIVEFSEGPNVTLLRKRARSMDLQGLEDPLLSDAVPLLSDLTSLFFSYLDVTGSWRPAWNFPYLPKAVRLELEQRRSGETARLAVVATIHNNVPAICARSPTFLQCRTMLAGTGVAASGQQANFPAAPGRSVAP